MQPEQQYSQMSTSYLDQIAAPPQKTSNNKSFFALIIGVVLAALLVFFLVLGASSGSSPEKVVDQLSLRFTNTQVISIEAQTTISNLELRNTNARLSTLLVQAQHDLNAIQPPSFDKPEKAPKDLVALEDTKDLVAKLTDAKFNGIYDRTYAGEMSYLLENTGFLMESLYDKTKNEELKTTLATNYKDLQEIQKEFADYHSSSETSIFD